MTRAIPSTSDSAPPAPPPAPTELVDRLTRIFSNRLEDDPADFRRKRVPARLAATGEARTLLEERFDLLCEALGPTPGPQANRSIFLLITGKVGYGADDRELSVKVRVYADALSDQPDWAIEAARLRFRRPGWRCLWSGVGCPSEVDVGAECRHETLPFAAELARIEAILRAEPYETGATDDERADAVAYAQAAVAEMRGRETIAQKTDEKIAAEAAAMERCNERFRVKARALAAAEGRGQAMWGRIPIGDELARQIGLAVSRPDTEPIGGRVE